MPNIQKVKTLEPEMDRLLKMSVFNIERELIRSHNRPAHFRPVDVKRLFKDWQATRFLLSKIYEEA